ncbi:DUF7426 family protein [Serinicoccus sediminis]|uniref:DUF7426 family protein n=1 Tax=Serinicoccus sediminis TaxID=2306021 RepID=UPI00101FC399|nr:hypothetical protein [Serinicoccus sediminis]
MSNTLTLPVAGREYVIPQPPARVGLAQVAAFTISRCRRQNIDPPAYAVERWQARYGTREHDMDEDALGPVAWERMQDELTMVDLKRAAAAAHIWIATGSERAALLILDPTRYLEQDGGEDEAPKASTSADAASTTPTPDSTSGTRSPSSTGTA